MSSEQLSGGELILVIIGGAVLAVGGVVWGGANLSAMLVGRRLDASLGDAVTAAVRLTRHLSNPTEAWPVAARPDLPGPILYWSATLVIASLAVIGGGVVLHLMKRSPVGTKRRRPLGVDAQARFGRARDLRTIIVKGPTPGRFILGRVGRHLVATESSRVDWRSGWLRRPDRRQGDRGAVALIGPSRCGKTSTVISGILDWTGPAILSSVKDDLLRHTIKWRSEAGDVKVFDPTGVTGCSRASWSPMRGAGTPLGAQRSARSLCEAVPRGGNVDGGVDYWLAQAEILLTALMFIAWHSHGDIGTVARWVLAQERPTDFELGEVKEALDVLLADERPEVLAGATKADEMLGAIWRDDERTRASIYSTARTLIWPWANADVAASSRGESIDLKWLLEGDNTVYLCAPIEDRTLFAPVFGGLLNDLIRQIYRHVGMTGKPIDPPLLIVIDEAGNTPLRELPEYASTLAGMGVVLVTVWQSLAQIQVAYGRSAGTVLTNSVTKAVFSGTADPDLHRYVHPLLGDHEIEAVSQSIAGRTTTQRSTARLPLVPAHVPRQMLPGDAMLIHGTLPPAHLKGRPYFADRRLAQRAS